MQATLEAVAPGSFSLQMNLLMAVPVNSQLQTPQETISQTSWQSHSLVPDPQKLQRYQTFIVCFKPISLGLTFYTEINNSPDNLPQAKDFQMYNQSLDPSYELQPLYETAYSTSPVSYLKSI